MRFCLKACFKVSTGDVEDAPALDPLAKFEIIEKDGAVYIKGDEETIKSSKRTLDIKCSASGEEKVLVVGGCARSPELKQKSIANQTLHNSGSGTNGIVEALRGSGFKGHITVICSEATRTYDRTKLSKALLADLDKAAWRSEDFYKSADIQFVQDKVTDVDFNKKSVSTESGKSYSYTKLVLATGASPSSLPLPGLKAGELDNVFLLRTLQHTQAITSALGDSPKQVVVIGSSFIGMEVANFLANNKHTVTVVGMESAPTENVFGAKVGKVFQGILEKNGVKFIMDAEVSHASPDKQNSSRVGSVSLKGGQELKADLVILGVGVKPATQFLQEKPDVKMEKDGSLRVDEHFNVIGQPDVYALGDIATYPYKGAHVRIEHWNVAQNAGRAAARHIVNPKAKPKPFIPVFWSALGMQLRYCGHASPQNGGYDDVVIKGETSPDKPSFVAFYTQGQKIMAVATLAKDPVMARSVELMKRDRMPTKKEIEGGKDILQASL